MLALRSFDDNGVRHPVWLSAIVLQELYAGAIESGTQKLLRRLENSFRSVNRLVVPSLSDWTDAGITLCQIGRKFGFEDIGKNRISNDTLIAMNARRNGLTLLTVNARDFEKIAMIKEFHWSVI